jgi:hypothetical protein
VVTPHSRSRSGYLHGERCQILDLTVKNTQAVLKGEASAFPRKGGIGRGWIGPEALAIQPLCLLNWIALR